MASIEVIIIPKLVSDFQNEWNMFLKFDHPFQNHCVYISE